MRERGELAFGTIDSWLLWHLSGRLHPDRCRQYRARCSSTSTLDWDPVLLERFRIPPVLLPRVVASSGVRGETDPALFGAAIPIAGIGGDHRRRPSARPARPGMAKNTYGTGCFLLAEHRRCRWRLRTGYCHRGVDRGGCGAELRAPEGSVFMGGAVVVVA